MRIQLNGRERELPKSISVDGLLEELGLKGNPVAVAVNREVVPRDQHPQRQLKEGDAVEIIQAVAGG